MLDRYLRPLIDPPLDRLGRALAGLGIGANAVTALGLALGLALAGCAERYDVVRARSAWRWP